MIIAGVDFSYSSPAVCIGEEGCDFKDLKFYAFRQKKKQFSKDARIVLLDYPLWVQQEQRFDTLATLLVKTLVDNNVEKIFIEGYAYAGKGLVFEIAEATGVFKNKVYQEKISIDVLTPSHVKKVATGKGNAGKELMMEYFLNKCDFCISAVLGDDAPRKPMDDIIDAYWIREAGIKKGS